MEGLCSAGGLSSGVLPRSIPPTAVFAEGGSSAAGFDVSSVTSLRSSPSEVNIRRSVTVKLSFLSAIYNPSQISRIRALKNFRKRQFCYPGAGLPGLENFARGRNFFPDISERDGPLSLSQGQGSHAGDLAYLLAIHFKLRSWRGQGTLDKKAGERTMHTTARANAFHNLLPDVAALGETQRPHLFGFLGKITVMDVPSVGRNAGRDAIQFQRFAPHRGGVGFDQCSPKLVDVFRSQPDFV